MSIDNSALPQFLQTYNDLSDYIRNTLDDLDNTEKGRSFARFVSRMIPLSELGEQFISIGLGQDSKDGGVDLISNSIDEEKVLYGQSKLTIKKTEEIDGIISKFKNYHDQIHVNKVGQGIMPEVASIPITRKPPALGSNKARGKTPHKAVVVETNFPLPTDYIFLIATLSPIKNRILSEYEKSSFASKDYYNKLKAEGRIVILDGNDMFPLAQSAYRKTNILPSNINLHLATPFIKQDNVYIGVVSADELKKCYNDFGEALFLDNIRLFLGFNPSKTDRDNINIYIKDTADNRPEEMLARNNGITFRSSKVTIIGDTHLQLDQASIVNGCQTTMCIVHSNNSSSYVLVKIVEVSEAWSIAKTANSQTKVDQIVLDLARYIRPQAVKMAAGQAGYTVEDKNETIYDVFDSIYQENIRYDEIFSIFLGLFSRTPNNVIRRDYNELHNDMLRKFEQKDPSGEATLLQLVRIYKVASKGRELAETRYKSGYSDVFQRFWKESKSDYRSLITILSACGCSGNNIYASKEKDITTFLDQINNTLLNDEARFIRYYLYSYEAILTYLRIKNENKSSKDIQRSMYEDLKSADFSTLYDNMCMIADGREPEAIR